MNNLKFITYILIVLFFIKCKVENKQNESKNHIHKNGDLKEITIHKDSAKLNQERLIDEEYSKKFNFDSVIAQLEPEPITNEEFENFKKKSNYVQVIKDYDNSNPSKLLGGKDNQENIRYYEVPTEINTKEYISNSILFGDLNEDKERDCIIIAYRSDGYNEVAYFYVFINNGTTFKLENVKNEDDICGCKKEGWPSLFRYQIIEDGYLKGVSMCHYEDAHCCPTMIFQTKVKFINGELKFISAEFIKDDYPSKRDRPKIDSVLKKSKLLN